MLVVDDDFMVARLHRGFVDTLPGFSVAGVAHTGIQALNAVEQLQPDIVLLDIYLPDIGDLEVLQRLRAGPHRHVEVVVVTAARDTETIARSLQLGARHYLIKPFRRRDLHERLEQVVRARADLDASGGTEIVQDDVDRIFGAPPQLAAIRPPKGLSPVTLALVVARLRELDLPCTATSLGADLGLSRVTARRYLDHLVKDGAVRVELRYGDPGRPEHHYIWNA